MPAVPQPPAAPIPATATALAAGDATSTLQTIDGRRAYLDALSADDMMSS
jgi:hypothetical protein